MSLQDIEDAYPLTSIQQGMLFHCLEFSESDVYVSYISIDISGSVEPDRLRTAWQSVVNRHGSLRASFQWEGLDEPLAVIRRAVDIPWELCDWSEFSDAEHTERYLQLQRDQRQVSISPSAYSLQRFNLVKLASDNWKLLWSIHHLLADGWSTPIVINEVMQCYDNNGIAPANLNQPFNFSGYVAWLGQCDMAAADSYWSRYLGQARVTPLNLPRPQMGTWTSHQSSCLADKPEQVHQDWFQRVEYSLSVAETNQLKQYCRENGVTLSTVMHGLWAIVLQHYCGTSQVVFCTTSSGRQCKLNGVDTAVGLFLNSLPVTVQTESTDDLQHWFADIQRSIQESIAFDFTPLSSTLDHLTLDEDRSIESIVVMEGHNNDWKVESAEHGIAFSNIEYITHSNFPLAVLVYPGKRLSITLVFDSRRFSEVQVSSLSGQLAYMIDNLATGRAVRVDEMARACRKTQFAKNARRYHGIEMDAGSYTSTGDWLDSVCQSYPDRVALIDAEQKVTYQSLYLKSNQIANMLIAICSPDAQYIGVYCERSAEQIAAFYGIVKAGLAYIPLDPSYPAERTRLICDDSSAALVLCGGSVEQPDYITSVSISDAASYSQSFNHASSVSLSSAVYLMYTSGSTGHARGVVVTHENLIHSTCARRNHYKLAVDRFILLSSCSFDSSVAGIYGTLCSGGTLILPEQGQEKDVEAIAGLIDRHQVTQTLCLPGLYRLLLQSGERHKLVSLRTVIVAGESCPIDLPALHSSVLPSAALFNEYGPTEATVWASVCQLDTINFEQLDSVPIGAPISNTTMFALDDNGHPCLPGVEGQLAIGGPGVTQGYHSDVEKTRQRFVDLGDEMDELGVRAHSGADYARCYLTGDLGYLGFDGLFRFTGRLDRQIKMRGFRIEPSEIEAALVNNGVVSGEVLVTKRKTAANVELMSTEELRAVVAEQLKLINEAVASELVEAVKNGSCITVERE